MNLHNFRLKFLKLLSLQLIYFYKYKFVAENGIKGIILHIKLDEKIAKSIDNTRIHYFILSKLFKKLPVDNYNFKINIRRFVDNFI